MATDINQVVLVGRLTRDAELKYTSGGMPVCAFSIAVNYKKKSGDQWTEEVSFFDIVLFGRQGEAIHQYLGKGKQVAVSGELRQDRWEQDGQSRSKVKIIAANLQLLGGGGSGGSGGSGGAPAGGSPSNQGGGGRPYQSGAGPSGGGQYGGNQAPNGGGPDDFDDDIPF